MKIPFKYTYRNFKTRKLTAVITVSGISLVVFVFTAALMMAYGVEKTLVSTGLPENVMVVRKSSQGEITSIIDGETQNVIRTLPHIAKSPDGKQLITTEPVVVINLDIRDGGVSNVTVRGVSQTAFLIRPQVKIIEGRMFNPSLKELIVGKAINNKFLGTDIGSTIKFAGDDWKVVGIFEDDLRLQAFEPIIEQKYFEEQSELLAGFIRILGTFITIIFSFGATICAMITMYSAVANRTVEIGTLRSLGFSRRSILSAFLIESLFISMLGGVIGLFLASFLQFFSLSTLNWSSFAELSFSFSLSTEIVISSLIFAAFMGFIGGFLPSVRAARLNIVNTLRAG